MYRTILAATMILVLLTPSLHAMGGEEVLYSVLFPGWGQMKAGRYMRGSLLVSAEIISLTGLLLADIQYDRATEQYFKYRAYCLTADYIGDADNYCKLMNEKWDDSERLHKYRKVFIGTAVGVWVVGVVDMLWGPGTDRSPLAFEASRDGFIVTGTFSF